MLRYEEKGKAQIEIGGKDYGAVEIGHEDMPGKAVDKILEALLQIQTGEQPHFNMVFGEGEVRRGITIIDGIVSSQISKITSSTGASSGSPRPA